MGSLNSGVDLGRRRPQFGGGPHVPDVERVRERARRATRLAKARAQMGGAVVGCHGRRVLARRWFRVSTGTRRLGEPGCAAQSLAKLI